LVGKFEGPLAAYIGASLLLIGAVSTYWDIATHIDVGRERFLTPAHIGIYSAVLLSAIAVALSGLADHFGAGDSFLTALRHPFRGLRPGIGVAGAGMLTTLAAAPFDNAWHEIYGIDVTIWSPPHLLAISGIAASTLGLAALVAPAITRKENRVYPVLFAALLTAFLITTGEFEFNAPQYRIAYHPIILAAASSLIFTAAAGRGWRATKVALWFELVRVVAVMFLFTQGRSLAYAPFLLPAAVLADLIPRNKARGLVSGVAIAIAVVASNWIVLQLLPGLRWPSDDLMLATPFVLVVGAAAGWLGTRLGSRLDGELQRPSARTFGRAVPIASAVILSLAIAAPAFAHEVGGRRGAGTIEWSPQVPEAGQVIHLRISDLSLDSGAPPTKIQIEAWRAEHRIRTNVTGQDAAGTAELTLPDQGLWFLFIRAEAGDEHLLWGDHFTVAEQGQGVSGVHQERFTLGVDTLAGKEPAAWIDLVAYGFALAIFVLLLRGVVRALARLPIAA
jgi:hypothetical protein